MAIQKDFEFKGFNANYHKITGVSIDEIGNEQVIRITVSIYKDREQRLANKNDRVSTKTFEVSAIAFADLWKQNKALIYPYLETLKDFENSTPILES